MLTKDPDTSAEFYSSLFDWQVDDDNSLGYKTVRTGTASGIDGGFWPAPPEGHSMVTLYVQVDDVRRYFEKALSQGAKPVTPPQKLSGGDEMAIFQDPLGVSIGLVKQQEPEARGRS